MAEGWRRPRLWHAVGWILIGAVASASLLPPSEVPGSSLLPDKAAHLIAYAVLMGWHVQLLERGSSRWRHALGFMALGIALEGGQAWLGYRTFELADMLANGAGIALGWHVSGAWMPGGLRRLDRVLPRPRAG